MRINRKFVVFLAAVVLTLSVYFVNHLVPPFKVLRLGHIKIPKLFLCTRFFYEPYTSNSNQPLLVHCPNGEIYVYQNPDCKNVSGMDAVLFHWSDINPPSKSKHVTQKWILFRQEPPTHERYQDFHLRTMQTKIDWVMGYRHDSDIVAPYGFSVKTGEAFTPNQSHRVEVNFAGKQRFLYGVYDKINESKIAPPVLKHKQVAWLVSHCDVASNRKSYINELSKHIHVDIYGECGSLKCPRGIECKEFLANEYNFYLAFENSICKDYITEKSFDALKVGSLPVVFGGANYTELLPPNSFIDALSFNSPKELGDYLHLVASNQSLFESYFKWRSDYLIFSAYTKVFHDRSWDSWICSIFDAIIENRPSRNDTNLKRWYYKDAKCRSWNRRLYEMNL